MYKTEENATAAPFTVKPGYYAVARSEGETLYYTPNPVIGEEAGHKVWVEPDLTITADFGGPYEEEYLVYAYDKKFVKANCPQGYSAVILQMGEEAENVVKRILYNRPLRVGNNLNMECLVRFFRSQGMSVTDSNALFLKELKHIVAAPLRVFDMIDSYEDIPKGRWMNPDLSFQDARYASLCCMHLVCCQQPFKFFGKDLYAVFYKGEIESVGELRQNDSFQIILPQ